MANMVVTRAAMDFRSLGPNAFRNQFRVLRFGLNAPEIDAAWNAGTMPMIRLITNHRRMVFTKVSDLVTIGMVEAQLGNRPYYMAVFQIDDLVMHKGKLEATPRWAVRFENVLIENTKARVYIDGTDTAVDTVWMVADKAEFYIPTGIIFMHGTGYH